jgi:E3 ubiquitin-protein ligase HECTD2
LTTIAFALSVDRTRTIIDHCIAQYLESLLLPDQSPAKPRHNSSLPPSPLFDDDSTPEAILFNQAQDSESHSQRSPSKRSETTRQTFTPRSKATMRSPSDPTLPPMHLERNGHGALLPGFVPTPSAVPQSADRQPFANADQPNSDDEAGFQHVKSPTRAIFRPLETYIADCFSGCATLNASFFTARPQHSTIERGASSEEPEKPAPGRTHASSSDTEAPLS